MPIQNIFEIFTLNGEAFVSEAYKVLLDREPDSQGLAYYCGRMAAGYNKSYIVYQIYMSSEAISSKKNIKGLAQLIQDERRAQSRIWRFFQRGTQKDYIRQERHDSLLFSLRSMVQEEIAQSRDSFRHEVDQLRQELDPAGQKERAAQIVPELKALVQEEIAQTRESFRHEVDQLRQEIDPAGQKERAAQIVPELKALVQEEIAQTRESFRHEVDQLRQELDPAGQKERAAQIVPELKALVQEEIAQSRESFRHEVDQLRQEIDPAGQKERAAQIVPELKALVQEEIAQSRESFRHELKTIQALMNENIENQAADKSMHINEYRKGMETNQIELINTHTQQIYDRLKRTNHIKDGD